MNKKMAANDNRRGFLLALLVCLLRNTRINYFHVANRHEKTFLCIFHACIFYLPENIHALRGTSPLGYLNPFYILYLLLIMHHWLNHLERALNAPSPYLVTLVKWSKWRTCVRLLCWLQAISLLLKPNAYTSFHLNTPRWFIPNFYIVPFAFTVSHLQRLLKTAMPAWISCTQFTVYLKSWAGWVNWLRRHNDVATDREGKGN